MGLPNRAGGRAAPLLQNKQPSITSSMAVAARDIRGIVKGRTFSCCGGGRGSREGERGRRRRIGHALPPSHLSYAPFQYSHTCHCHSAATARASNLVGSTSGRRAGVLTGRPSNTTAWPPPWPIGRDVEASDGGHGRGSGRRGARAAYTPSPRASAGTASARSYHRGGVTRPDSVRHAGRSRPER